MSSLVIEYVFEGHRRGYNFTSPTKAYDEETLRAIWRGAMPRGRGWGAPQYTGARSIKAFPLPGRQIAVSEVIVTGEQDENGRRGIRRALVDVMRPPVYGHHLTSRLAGYPDDARAAAADLYEHSRRSMPRLRYDAPLVVSFPFTTGMAWQVVEALVLMLVSSPTGSLRRQPPPLTFTTLALDPRDGSKIVALPAAHTDRVKTGLMSLA
jgi:hypothetical protein